MIKKLTIKKWISAAVPIVFCVGVGIAMLCKYGMAALLGLRGYTPSLTRTQSMENIYLGAALGVVLLVLGVVIIVRQLSLGVGKQVKQYLTTHPDATMEQLDSDYESAQRYGDLWIGSRWTFSYDIVGLILENTDIAWVFTERDSGRHPRYFICLGMIDGKVVRVSVDGDLLPKIKERYAQYPHILLENIAEYEPIFKNNLNAFLDIQYNRSMKS